MGARIKFKISKDGKISIEVLGVNDASCADITAAFERELGTVEDVQQKPEYFIEMTGMEAHVHEEE